MLLNIIFYKPSSLIFVLYLILNQTASVMFIMAMAS